MVTSGAPGSTVRAVTAPAVLTVSSVRDAVQCADRWIAVQQRQLRVPGVQVAVWYDGEVVLSSAHGVADLAPARR